MRALICAYLACSINDCDNAGRLIFNSFKRCKEFSIRKDVFDCFALNEGECQKFIERLYKLATIDEMVFGIATGRVLCAPCFVVDIGEIVDIRIDLHINGVVLVQVVGELFKIDIEYLGCFFTHGRAFLPIMI